jgi:hypothetical protein
MQQLLQHAALQTLPMARTKAEVMLLPQKRERMDTHKALKMSQ